jgi:hypothetical protein
MHITAYLVGMSEPSGSFLLTAHESNPFVTASAQTFPDIRVTIHAASLLRLLKGTARCGADAMGETLIVPEGAILQDKPSSRLADPAPSLALISVAADPTRSVEVTVKPKFLLVGLHIRVAGLHILFRRWDLIFMKRSIQIRWIAQISIVGVQRVGICITL